jgi:hypothetical protein
MSLGWGKLSDKDWKDIKVGPGQDMVPPGDYEVELEAYRHLEARDNKPGCHIVQMRTTDSNVEDYQGKQLDYRMNYDPNPTTDGRVRMNAISHESAKALLKACNAEDQHDTEGMVDIPATLQVAVAAKPRVVVTASRNGEYQDIKNPRSSV